MFVNRLVNHQTTYAHGIWFYLLAALYSLGYLIWRRQMPIDSVYIWSIERNLLLGIIKYSKSKYFLCLGIVNKLVLSVDLCNFSVIFPSGNKSLVLINLPLYVHSSFLHDQYSQICLTCIMFSFNDSWEMNYDKSHYFNTKFMQNLLVL